jgi:glycosyltransferase involved in cell wall biosynthesis
MSRVSVVLPVYNHEHYLEHALRSLFAQTHSDFEIIAVDDGSTDASLEILNRHAARLTVIESCHEGPAAARNRAIEAADSEFIAFMDADDLCSPERLEWSLTKLENERLDLVASASSFIDAKGEPLPGSWTCPSHAKSNYWGSLLERNWIATPSVMVRSDVLRGAGLFDERFTRAEDYDLWLRIGRGASVGYLDSPLVQCRRYAATTSMNIDSHQYFERMALQKVDRMEAWNAFNKLYRSAPKATEAWIWFLLRSGDPAFVEESAFAIAQHPQSHAVRFALGVFAWDTGRYDKAVVTFQQLKDHDAASLHNFAVSLARCGDRRAALFHLEAAITLRPDYHDARYNLAALRAGREPLLTRRPFREDLVTML